MVSALAGVATAILLAGCGDDTYGSSHGTKEQAKAAVETWLGACAVEDGEAVLVPLARSTREMIFKAPEVIEGCERIADLTPVEEPSPEELTKLFGGAHVEHVAVDGGTGTATVRAPNGRTSEFELEVDRGRWLLSNPSLVSS